MVHPVVVVLLGGLATLRLDRLIRTDTITSGLRRAALRHLPLPAAAVLAIWITCPWCVTIWTGAVSAYVVWLTGALPGPWWAAIGLTTLAYSQLAAGWREITDPGGPVAAVVFGGCRGIRDDDYRDEDRP